MSLFIFSLLYSGLAALCMAMERHYKTVWGNKPEANKRRAIQFIGWFLLGFSFWLSYNNWENGTGSAAWLGLLSIAAFSFTVLLTYKPKIAVYLAPTLSLITGVAAAL
ncbi:MAG: DUF3325 domain-containing protein [Kordiimonadaceae bacterium]|nr:DUF3325 domain-containing protein [Kordiimonadaceae bacterium]